MKKKYLVLLGFVAALSAGIFSACKPKECEVHDFGEWQVVTPATCDAEGVKRHTCTVCKKSEDAPVQKTAHSYGNWEIVTEPTCQKDGVRQRVCSACGDIVKSPVIAVTGGHSEFSDWAIVKKPTCKETGTRRHYCVECGEAESEIIPADPNAHLYGVWKQTVAPTCGSAGKKVRTCVDCGAVEEEEVPTDGEHDFSNRTVKTVSTCVTKGVEVAICPECKTEREFELPLDLHNHKNMGGGSVCPDCGGLLGADLTLNNSTGKFVSNYEKYLEGDFTIEYLFRSTTGLDPFWDSFILTVSPAEYINGKLMRMQVAEMNVIPSPPGSGSAGDFTTYYSPVWDASGNRFETTWFFDEDGTDLIYQTCMALSPTVKMTVTNRGGVIDITAVMTVVLNGKEQHCTVTATLNYAGTERFYLSLSGEDSVQTLQQVSLKAGKFAAETEPTKTFRQILAESKEYNNKGLLPNGDGYKNIETSRYAFTGDFDVVYKFTMDGNPASDWHSWIFYIYNGRSNFNVSGAQKLYWSGIANGAEPEQSALWHNADFYYRHDFTSNFAAKMATADVTLRFVRRNGYITMYGAAWAQGENTPFVSWTFMSLDKTAEDLVTIALTSENSKIIMKEVLLYSGTAFTTDGKCIFHEYGDWKEVIAPNCGEAGEKQRVCGVCGDIEKAEIPAERAHEYGEWVTVEEAKCGTEGRKKHTCTLCGHEEFDIIPAASDHTYGEWTQTAATCSKEGEKTRTCTGCGYVDRQTIPVSIYAHSAMKNGVCADCGGMIEGVITVDNTAGKAINFYTQYYEGDFEAVYSLHNNAGADGNWHNYFLTIGPAEYINGQLVRTGISEYNILSFFPNPLNVYYGDSGYTMWQKLGNVYETTWFCDENGAIADNILGFGDFMKLGAEVTVTLKRVGKTLNVTLLNEVTYNNKPYTCRVTAALNYPGAERVFVGLTGESSSLQLNQAKLLSGKLASLASPTKLNTTNEVYTNDTTKSVQGRNDTFKGDFSIEYRFAMNGNPESDWHSWIGYILYGKPEDYNYQALIDNAKMYYSFIANGAEPEQCQGAVYHGMDFMYFLRKTVDDTAFKQKLADCNVSLRISRANGYISVIGTATAAGENDPFAYWTFYTMDDKGGETVTVRLTTENSTMAMKEVLLYRGDRVDG